MTEIAAVPQKIVDRRIIVLKSRVDHTMARLLGERMKQKIFTRARFLKPKPVEIQLVSINKYYRLYVIVGGKYAIDYCKRNIYSVNVDKNAREVAFFDRKFKPEPLNQLPHDSQVIKLDGVEYFHHEDEASFILDKRGREIDPKQLPCAPSEKQNVEELAKAGIKFEKVKFSREEEIEFLQSKIANKPSDVGEVIREMFEVSERALIYCPMYKLKFRHVKTGKQRIVKIDGITGKIVIGKCEKTISNKFMKEFVEDLYENMQRIDEKIVESKPELPESIATKKDSNILKKKDMISRAATSPPQVSVLEFERNIGFPGEVFGEVSHVDNSVTVEGDLRIPSGTIVHENLEVKGILKIGSDCQILGKVEALRDIIIGLNSKIDGNVVSGGDIIVGPDVVVNGSVESNGQVEIGENAVIKGPLRSKSSVVLNSLARVCTHE